MNDIYNPENYTTYGLADIKLWSEDFENIRTKILQSTDPKRENYSKRWFEIEQQEAMTVMYYEDHIIAFSTLFAGKTYPVGVSRILNRSWKDPDIRWQKPAYWFISQIMLTEQIRVAKILNKKAVFVSSEGNRKLWLKRWLEGADKDFPGWIQINGMAQVCGGDYEKCWQNVGYLLLDDAFTFELDTISYNEWKEFVLEK